MPIYLYRVEYKKEDIAALFASVDTDNNELIDALELLLTLAITSGRMNGYYSIKPF